MKEELIKSASQFNNELTKFESLVGRGLYELPNDLKIKWNNLYAKIATLESKIKYDEDEVWRIKEDNICPATNEQCDDECCPVGAICNLKSTVLNENNISDCEPEQLAANKKSQISKSEGEEYWMQRADYFEKEFEAANKEIIHLKNSQNNVPISTNDKEIEKIVFECTCEDCVSKKLKSESIEISTNEETIICSAIKLENGKIYFGHRHNHCLEAINGELSWNMNRQEIAKVSKEQGFITNLNRFVDRKEGAKIFIASGGKLTSDSLYSEDLY